MSTFLDKSAYRVEVVLTERFCYILWAISDKLHENINWVVLKWYTPYNELVWVKNNTDFIHNSTISWQVYSFYASQQVKWRKKQELQLYLVEDHEDEADDDIGLSRARGTLQQADPGQADWLCDGSIHRPDRQALLRVELRATQLWTDSLPYTLLTTQLIIKNTLYQIYLSMMTHDIIQIIPYQFHLSITINKKEYTVQILSPHDNE